MQARIRQLQTPIIRRILYVSQIITESLTKPWSYIFARFVEVCKLILKVLKITLDSAKKLVLKIGGEVIFVTLIIFLILAQNQLSETLSLADQNLLQNFIEWYAVIYTIILSVIIGQAWRKYIRVNNEIDREADALVLLVQTARMFKDEYLSSALFLAVKRYVKCLILLQSKDRRTNGELREKLRAIREYVVLLMQSETDDCLKSDLLYQYNEVYDARGDRFDLIEQKLPNHTWIIFIIASLVWLWGFLWLNFESTNFKFYILGSTIFTLSYLFYVARDLNDPTTGNWKMKFTSFETHIF